MISETRRRYVIETLLATDIPIPRDLGSHRSSVAPTRPHWMPIGAIAVCSLAGTALASVGGWHPPHRPAEMTAGIATAHYCVPVTILLLLWLMRRSPVAYAGTVLRAMTIGISSALGVFITYLAWDDLLHRPATLYWLLGQLLELALWVAVILVFVAFFAVRCSDTAGS